MKNEETEDQLQESGRRYNSLIENIPVGVSIVQDGKIVYANRQVSKITGYSIKEINDIGGFELVHPEDRVNVRKYYSERMRAENTPASYAMRMLHKDGSIHWLDRITTATTWNSRPAVLVMDRDITNQEEAKNALKISQDNFRNSLDNFPLGIRIASINSELLYANQALLEICGYKNFDEIKNTPVKDRFTPESYMAHLARKEQSRRGEPVPSRYEVNIIRRDGQQRDLQVIRKEVIWNGGPHFLFIYEDITEKKQAENRAREIENLTQLNKAKSELLANVSHELRTPLASIKGYVETLIEPDVTWTREQQLDFLQSANSEIDRLTLLIRDLLDMSRIDSGKMILDRRTYPVSEVLDSVSGVLSILSVKHKLRIKANKDLPPIKVDKIRIGQVLTNLVDNAAKFSAEGSRISLEVKAENEARENVIFQVKDEGEGISQEAAGNLFNRFYQAERVVAGKTRGTGLGLAICKGIIEAHGGRIWVESQPGRGSTFSFSIPLERTA